MEQNQSLVKQSDMPVLTFQDVKKYFCERATEKEVGLFIQVCKSTGLNPFKREAYLTKYGDAPATIITGYEVYLKRAERSGKWNGYKVWTEGSVKDNDLKAIVEIYRKDWDKPFVHEVYYEEYVQKTKEGVPNKFWREKPRTMLKKVVIAQGMRLCFPDEIAGLPYTNEEINEGAEVTKYEVVTDAVHEATKKVEKETGMNLDKETHYAEMTAQDKQDAEETGYTAEPPKPKGKPGRKPKDDKSKPLAESVKEVLQGREKGEEQIGELTSVVNIYTKIEKCKTHQQLNDLYNTDANTFIDDDKIMEAFKARRSVLTESLLNEYIAVIKGLTTVEEIAKIRGEIMKNKYIKQEAQETLNGLLNRQKEKIG